MKTQNKRMQIVISEEVKEVVEKAAKKKRLSLSEFMRRAALKEAEKTLGISHE